MDIHPEDCCADIFITGPGKCLGGAPGITIVSVTDRAWRHIEANPKTPTASVLSYLDWKDAWSKKKAFPFTPSVAEVNGLDAVLDQYLDEGPQNVWHRHALTAAACRAGIKAMGLELWAKTEAIASPTTTAVRIPKGLVDADIIRTAREQFGVAFSTGRGETQGKLLRIGHMGLVAEPIYAVVALTALGGAIRKLGKRVDVAAGIEAAMKTIDKGQK
jgi:pyridoxamine--pyruvate transaminase